MLHACMYVCMYVGMHASTHIACLDVCMYLHPYVMTFKRKNAVVCAGPAVTSLVQCPRHPILAFGE